MKVGVLLFPSVSIIINLCAFLVALWYHDWKKALYFMSGATITWSAVF